ncbi:MAG: ribosome recycling factor [Deltaproteobacteria bacterium]
MPETIYKELHADMEKAIADLQSAFSKTRTGRASVTLLDDIRVDYYGSLTPLNQLANLSAPESRLILVAPWDTSSISAIEKAIQKADLGLVPNNDGKVVRINIPVLTEERRKELAKAVKKMGEEYKVRIRNVRRDINEKFKAMKKDSKISEDQLFTCQDEVQKKTDKFIVDVDKLVATKEKEIMAI